MPKMKIWFMSHYTYMPEDGPHVRHYAMGKYLARKGYEPYVFASNELHGVGKRIETGDSLYIEKQSEGVRFFYIKSHHYEKNDLHRLINIFSFDSNAIKASKKIESKYGKPDVIYASCFSPTTVTAGIKLARKYGIKCICETRDLIPDGFITKGTFNPNGIIANFARKYMKKIYQRSDSLVFTMSGGAQYISDLGWDLPNGGKIDPKKIYYINNGVDLEEVEKNEKEYILPDDDLDKQNQFNVVYLGAIRFMNKMPLYLEAARELIKLGRKDIKILMWGTGTKIEEMRKQLDAEGITNLVLKGFVDKRYIPGIAKRADLFIGTGNSSIMKYGMSFNKLFDYLAAGKPIILPFKVGNSIVESNGAGIEMDDASGKELAYEIIRFADMDESEYEEYCKNAEQLVLTFSYEELAKKLEEVLINTVD